VAADLAARARQVLAGLLVLAVLALSFGQAVAAPVSSWSEAHPAHLDRAGAHMTAVTAGSGDFGSPCQHDHGTHCPACCIAGGCAMVSGLLPADTPALPPIASAAPARPDVATPAPDGRGLAPALPPPRRIV
jgi:hypothetical protein